MQSQTLIDRIEIEPQTGQTNVRMLKQIVDDQGKVLASNYHRASIGPDDDPSAVISAVNTHLVTLGYPAVKVEDVAVLDSAIAPLANLRAAKALEMADKAKQR